VTNGRTAIGDRLEELVDVWGLRMRVEGSAIQFELNEDSEITPQWGIGWVGE
jgi:hypothetical protein